MNGRFLTIADLQAHPEHIKTEAPYTVEALREHPVVKMFVNAPDLVLRYAENHAQNNGGRMLLKGLQDAKEIMEAES